VSGGHAHGLYVHSQSPIHSLPAQCKLVGAILFILTIVVTPRESLWAYGVYALIAGGVASAAGVSLWFIVKRLVVEIPFVVFALFLPFMGEGKETMFLGLSMSVDGLWAGWNILIKATLGLSTTIILAATTEVAELLRGLDRLHTPRAITAIAGFMVRYADVITGEMSRMRVARESRAYDPRWFWQARAVAASAGSLFIRSFERGERVYLAMLSRGFSGSFPRAAEDAATRAQWAMALAPSTLGAVVAVVAWGVSV
jgi:cobalt/nickel transport system permease protein